MIEITNTTGAGSVRAEFTDGEAEAVGFALMRARKHLKDELDFHACDLLDRIESAYRKIDTAPSLPDVTVHRSKRYLVQTETTVPYYDLRNSKGRTVAHIPPRSWLSEMEQFRYASLFSASPGLVDAAKQAVKAICIGGDTSDLEGGSLEYHGGAADDIRAAAKALADSIAKAEGR